MTGVEQFSCDYFKRFFGDFLFFFTQEKNLQVCHTFATHILTYRLGFGPSPQQLDDRLEDLLGGYLQRFGQRSKMLAETVQLKMRELKEVKTRMAGEEFRARDREKQARERQTQAIGMGMMEESKGARSSSVTKGIDKAKSVAKMKAQPTMSAKPNKPPMPV